jgi:glycoside hydrolase-like protein
MPKVFSVAFTAVLCFTLSRAPSQLRARAQDPPTRTYLGFDLNTYPADNALPLLRKTFSFAGFWLSPPPGAKQNTWLGKRELLRAQGFGFLVLYRGPQINELKSEAQSAQKGSADARDAAAAAKREGFPPHAIIFLDIEEGGRLPAKYHAYLRSWVDALQRAGYRAAVYCSGMPVNEGGGVTIITSDDIRQHLSARHLAYWVYNDACPPSPGCAVPGNPPPPSASGIPYAAVWQFAQSPRRKEFTARCAATYHADGNCYVPSDSAHAWFLDVNSATTPDPSNGRGNKP